MDFGEMIGAGRRAMGFSQDELAEVLDREPSEIAVWEAGLEVPSSPTAVMELAAALKLDADDLMEAAVRADLPDTLDESARSDSADGEVDDDMMDVGDPDAAKVGVDDDLGNDTAEAVDHDDYEVGGHERQEGALSRLGSRVMTRSVPPSPSQVAMARAHMPAPPPSYMDDAQLMRLYRLRLIATAVAGIVMLWLFFWALGNMLDAIGVLWGSLRPGGS